MGVALSHLPVSAGKTVFWVASFSSGAALLAVYILVRKFEKLMQEKVAILVKSKVESLGEAAVSKWEKSEEQVKLLTAELEDSKAHYEHQINLLQSSWAKSKEQAELAVLQLERNKEEMHERLLGYEDLRQEFERLTEEKSRVNVEREEQLQHKEALCHEYQQTISEQRAIIEKKQRTIVKLEGKVHDLMYEIRSLLQLEEPLQSKSPPAEVPEKREELAEYYLPHAKVSESATSYDLSLLLRKYVETAENFKGLGFKDGKAPRFLDLSSSHSAIDLRCLFDSFRDETHGILFVFSLSEGKLLFVNQHAKTLLGWSQEKVMKEFESIVVSGYHEFVGALTLLETQKECTSALKLRCKDGVELPLQCFMGLITVGPFAHHVVGLLSPVKESFLV